MKEGGREESERLLTRREKYEEIGRREEEKKGTVRKQIKYSSTVKNIN